ncbi:efflux RND transporter periplasmic adaptor subunit [Rhodovibrionaceae bacterium A322]
MRRVTLAAVTLVPLLALSACKEEKVEKAEVIRPVKTILVVDDAGSYQRWFPGKAKATQEIDLSFNVGGPLIELPVNIGDELEIGDLVSKIDPATYQADVNKLIANKAQADAELENANAQYKRQKILTDKGHQTEAALDRYIAGQLTARAQVKAVEAQLARAQLDLSYTVLTAPFSGVVTATYVDNYQSVQAKEAVVRLLDRTRLEMVVNIPESLIRHVNLVQNIVVVFDTYSDRLIPATIKEVGTEASATTRTYPVTLIMDQPEDIQIFPGMAGRASGEMPAGADIGVGGIQVPASSIFTDESNENSFVWVVDSASSTVKRRQVKMGTVTDTGVVITAGLEAEERVVTAGASFLQEDQVVRLLNE